MSKNLVGRGGRDMVCLVLTSCWLVGITAASQGSTTRYRVDYRASTGRLEELLDNRQLYRVYDKCQWQGMGAQSSPRRFHTRLPHAFERQAPGAKLLLGTAG